MAELGIQKKQRRIWPWIVGLLIIALLVWAALQYTGAAPDLIDADALSVLDPARGSEDAAAA